MRSPMSLFFFSIALVVMGNLLYHISQKSIPQNANLFVSLTVAYGISIILCLISIPIFSDNRPFLELLKNTNWAVVGIGIGVFAVEVGFLLAYRSGWNLSTAAVTSSITITILFVPIGMFFFKEDINLPRILGIIFCILGLLLLSFE